MLAPGGYARGVSPHPAHDFDEDAPPPNSVRLGPRLYVAGRVLEFTFDTSGGPGGQNVNKVATRCRLRVAVAALGLIPPVADRLRGLAGAMLTEADELVVVANEHRSAAMNRDACVERLGDLVRRALVRPKVRRATKPTRGSKERRLGEKKRRGDIKKGRREEG